MNIQEIKQALMGKAISHFDGWDGSYKHFVIAHVEHAGLSVIVYDEARKGWGVYIPNDIIPELIRTGKYKEINTIDHCTFELRWDLSTK